jgi:hypothetical protein
MVISLHPSFSLPAFRPVEKMGEKIATFLQEIRKYSGELQGDEDHPAVGDLFHQDFPLSALFI